jgi:hypothetical protein
MVLGNDGNTTYDYISYGEVIIINGTITAEDREKLEGYLAHKWGLEASLPTNHPYKASAPDGSGSAVIANKGLAAISDTTATMTADLDATGTNYSVYVCYGTSDGGTNAASWAASTYVGSWTNVSTNISTVASGLLSGTTYYYTFMASNTAGRVWASPSWTFKTTGAAPQFTVNHLVPHAWLSGINASWSANYEAAVTNDPDGDGFATWQEYWSGTDPQNSNSFLKIDSISLSGSNLLFSWQHALVDAGVPPITIQARSNLNSGSWFDIGTHAPTNGVNLWSGDSSVQGFYRLAVTNAP